MNCTQLVTLGMQNLQVLAAGEVPSASELSDGMAVANNLLDSWNTERLFAYAMVYAVYSLTSGNFSYTIGAGAVFNGARPIKIEQAGILMPSGTSGTFLRTQLKPLTAPEWAAIQEKSALAANPLQFYYDANYPTGTLYFWPTPSFAGSTRQVELWSWQPLTAFPDLTTDVVFAPGYARAFINAFALDYAQQFGVAISPQLALVAAEAKAAIRALNGAAPDGEPPSGVTSALPEGGQ